MLEIADIGERFIEFSGQLSDAQHSDHELGEELRLLERLCNSETLGDPHLALHDRLGENTVSCGACRQVQGGEYWYAGCVQHAERRGKTGERDLLQRRSDERKTQLQTVDVRAQGLGGKMQR